jgi:hypothetical protein
MLGKFVQLRLQGVRDPFISMANGKAKAPPPPDYTGAATATAAGNLEAARATAAANRTNQVTPYGNLTYTANPGRDPYGNTLYTATQTLSPEQQAIYNQESKLNQGLMSTANTGLQYANQVLSQPGVNMSNLPSLTSNVPTGQLATSYDVQSATGNVANPNVQSSLNLSGVPALKSNIDQYGQIQNQINTQGLPSYGINPGETYSDAIMRRLQPDLERQRSSEESRLANQGIGLGSNAYSTAKDILGRQQNDALTSAIVQGMGVGLQANQQQFGQNAAQQQAINAAQAQGFGQNAAQTQAQNAANAQAFQQALAGGQFGNQAAGQQFGQNLSAAQLANQAAAQNTGNAANLAAFGNQGVNQQFQQGLANAQLGNQAQQQGFQQAAYNQMQPINVINALRSGSQVQSPSYAATPQQAATGGADILGATQAGYNAQLANVNAQNAASGNFMSGLMGLGGAGIMKYSDERLKTNIEKIGSLENGLNLYSYNYKDGYDLPEGKQIGVMAQEVEAIIPEAVVEMDNGFKAVNYAMLGV